MKKIILSVFAITAFTLLSQAQFKVGLKAGMNSTNQRISVTQGNSIYADDNFKTFHAGIITELKISDHLFLQPQLLYTRKGATHLSSIGDADIKVRINYIDLPVNLLYKINLPFGKLFGGAGAVFGYGFGGKQEQNGVKTKVYNDNSNWRHRDLGLSFTAGIELNNGFFVSMNSQKGLLDAYKGNAVSVKNRSTSFSIGYLINCKTAKKKS